MHKRRGESREIKVKHGDIVGRISTMVELDEYENEDNDWTMNKMKEQVNIGDQLTTQEKEKVLEMLLKVKYALSRNELDIGKANVTPHVIELTSQTPIWQRPRRFAEPINKEIKTQCEELINLDIIEKSSSPWSSPVVPVRKADGQLRLCVDYKKINSFTKTEKKLLKQKNFQGLT